LLLEAQAAASTKPIAVKPGSWRAPPTTLDRRGSRALTESPAPGFYAAPLHHANSYAPYPVPGAAGTSRYSPYGSYYSTGGFANAPSYSTGSFPPSRAGFASTQAQPRYPILSKTPRRLHRTPPEDSTFRRQLRRPPTTSCPSPPVTRGLLLRRQRPMLFTPIPTKPVRPRLPRSFGSPAAIRTRRRPTLRASTRRLAETEPRRHRRRRTRSERSFPGSQQQLPGQSSQRSGLTRQGRCRGLHRPRGWKSQSRAGEEGMGGYDSVPSLSLTGRPTISLPSLASIAAAARPSPSRAFAGPTSTTTTTALHRLSR